MEFLPALLLGLLGSAHCAGMCGPIAIGLPVIGQSWLTRVGSTLMYNGGRIFTYGILGLLFGLLGKGLSLGGLQQWASIGIGVIMILSIVFPMIFKKINLSSPIAPLISNLKTAFGRLFSVRTYPSLLFIGILNGFLPCGLVYIAVAGAVVLSDAYLGMFYMVVFGLGTLPAMFAITILGNVISLRFRKKISRIVPYFIILIGILFILRGMNLGIKYVSPKLVKEETTKMECCH
jgi:hypothetical protein